MACCPKACCDCALAKPMMVNWLTDLIADRDAVETKILTDLLISAKVTLRRNKVTE